MRRGFGLVLSVVVGLLVIAFMAIGCGNSLSENEACNMAKEYLKNTYREPHQQYKKLSIIRCTDFESNVDQGRAKIRVKYTYWAGLGRHGNIWRKQEGNRRHTFRRTDQGWKVSRF